MQSVNQQPYNSISTSYRSINNAPTFGMPIELIIPKTYNLSPIQKLVASRPEPLVGQPYISLHDRGQNRSLLLQGLKNEPHAFSAIYEALTGNTLNFKKNTKVTVPNIGGNAGFSVKYYPEDVEPRSLFTVKLINPPKIDDTRIQSLADKIDSIFSKK